MSSGKLELSPIVRNNKINNSLGYSELYFPSISSEMDLNLSLKYFPGTKDDFYEFYHKAFEIHLFLLRNENLSNQEKLDFCKLERNYIKLYLKAIMKKNYI